MHTRKWLRLLLIVLLGIGIGYVVVQLTWRVVSEYRIRHNNHPPKFQVDSRTIWRDPGNTSQRNLYFGPGGKAGVPVPPFRFI